MSLHRVNHRPSSGRVGAHPVRTVGLAMVVAAVFAATGSSFSPLAEVTAISSALAATAVAVPAVHVSPMADVDAVTWEGAQLRSDPGPAGAALALPDGSSGAQLPEGLIGEGLPEGISGSGYLPAAAALPNGIQFIHPVTSRRITSPYGWRHNPTGPGMQVHIGQDYAQVCGTPVRAAADGVVIQSAWAGHSGQRLTIDHGDGIRTGYSHNSSLIARVGDRVKQGQVISLIGSTGNSTGCHLHFEVIINGRWADPRLYLPVIPGQPRPIVDSSNTTVRAEPITNTGAPRIQAAERTTGSPYLPAGDRKPAVATPAPAKREDQAKPAKPTKPVASAEVSKPKPKPEPKPKPTKPAPTKPAPTKPAPKPAPDKPRVTPAPTPTTPAPSEAPKTPLPSAPTPSADPSTTVPSEVPASPLPSAPEPSATPAAPTPSPTPSASAPTPSISPTPSASPSAPEPNPTPSTSPSDPMPTTTTPADPNGSASTAPVPPTPPATPDSDAKQQQASELPPGSVCELEPVDTELPAPRQSAKENALTETGIVSVDGECLPPAEPETATKVKAAPPARKDG